MREHAARVATAHTHTSEAVPLFLLGTSVQVMLGDWLLASYTRTSAPLIVLVPEKPKGVRVSAEKERVWGRHPVPFLL